MTNIKFSDVVLLTIFGFLIYYLTKPSSSESFESLQEHSVMGKEVVGLFEKARKVRSEVVTPNIASAIYTPEVKPQLIQEILNSIQEMLLIL